MAKDDMEVILYKILKYMYESLKSGHKTTLEDVAWHCRLFDITREYWLVIMKELIFEEYATGIKYVESKDMEGILEVGEIAITKKGREYLTENRAMKKAEEMLGEAFRITLGAVVGRL